jgi:transcriptional regulator with XRE-family HTH domain
MSFIESLPTEPVSLLDPLAEALHLTRQELAQSGGISRDAISKPARRNAPATTARMHDLAEILNRAAAWAGSLQQGYAWYRGQPLPSFGDQTAEDLVRQGRADAVKSYLSRIAVGGYA